MKYELIALKEISVDGNYALIKIGTDYPQYVVAYCLDTERSMENNDLWASGHYFPATIEGLQRAIELFRSRTEENYMSRSRLEEIATKFKDSAFEISNVCDVEESLIGENLILNAELTSEEIEFFGIPKEAVEEYETTKSVCKEFM